MQGEAGNGASEEKDEDDVGRLLKQPLKAQPFMKVGPLFLPVTLHSRRSRMDGSMEINS